MQIATRAISIAILLTTFFAGAYFAYAQETNINDLNSEIASRKSEIDSISKKMEEYQSRINSLASQAATLRGDISIIENQIALAELDMEATQIQIEAKQLELSVLEEQIAEEEAGIVRQKEMIENMLFEMRANDDIGLLEVIFGSEKFSDLFQQVEAIVTVNEDLNNVLAATYNAKERLVEVRGVQEDQLSTLLTLEEELASQAANLDAQVYAKSALVSETQDSEAQYRVLMSELRQEREYITSQISALQEEVDQRLAEEDGGGETNDGPVSMSHPLPNSILTATFHDPTYPFRHLFEHSGVDLAAPTGTPIRAAAPGIVAWTRTGRSYGNYVMIIHANGFATLYAHMSSFNVSQDQYVSRGDIIGGVGSTGFSTGPHLHFEVRLNGIPVNPFNYLVD